MTILALWLAAVAALFTVFAWIDGRHQLEQDQAFRERLRRLKEAELERERNR